MEPIQKYSEMEDDYNDGAKLSQFFGVLKRFNNEEQISIIFIREVESFFEFKWINDQNYTEDYAELNDQMPERV